MDATSNRRPTKGRHRPGNPLSLASSRVLSGILSLHMSRRKVEITGLMNEREFPHLDVHRFRSAEEADAWLRQL